MRLKQQVADKINASSSKARRDPLTRQPVRGRAEAGALRIGEMERDALLAHGVSAFLHESMTTRSDGRFVPGQVFSGGRLQVPDHNSGLTIRPPGDGDDAGVSDLGIVSHTHTPRAFGLIQAEAGGMGIAIDALSAEGAYQPTPE